ncbi:aerobic respiration control sensor protein arcB [Massarina eburnea CBS 473.64]|uniref:Aerobic respiration control sensor protein arcB n=1 Tax=Massarina eburnea CBS 473.64 TaxID=1395130 RepID=A0A6A6S0S6_9PLEO|nr:aerobic respiration control sensor protein arcB [Massarina eburnea CBS 473.64]
MSETPPAPGTTTKRPSDELNQKALNDLDSISLREILDQDSRPTFVLDLDSDYLDYDGDTKHCLRPIFCNTALRLHDRLLDSVVGPDSNTEVAIDVGAQKATTYQAFKNWVTSVTEFDDSRDVFPLTIIYRDMLWTGSTIRRRWRIISGNQCFDTSHVPKASLNGSPTEMSIAPTRTQNSPLNTTQDEDSISRLGTSTTDVIPTAQSSTLVSSAPLQLANGRSEKTSAGTSSGTIGSGTSVALSSSPEKGCPDWTVENPKGHLSEHLLFARSMDWAATPLGRMSSWPVQFREIVNLVMRNPHPVALFWGEDLTMLYNEAYKNEVAGNKHPDLMGTGFSGPFRELWDGVSPIFRECARTGESVRKENDRLPIERYGYLEETFFSWSFVPVYGGTSKILGFYNAPFETTYKTIRSRRLETLQQLGEKLSEARNVKHFWACVLDGLRDNHYDVPFALLYSIVDSDDADTASHGSDSTISLKSCLLEGSIGIPDGHPAQPSRLDLKRSIEGFVPAFREAMRTREPTILHTRNGSLPEELIEGIQWRGHGDPCKEAIIIPIRPTNGENIFAFLLIGINPRRAYDHDYRQFAHMLNRQLATSLASFLLFEEEVRRGKDAIEAATLQREALSQQLELQANRMRRMTELSPLGMYLFDLDGYLLEANERYYEMTGHIRDDDSAFGFLHFMADTDSRERVKAMWEKMKTDPGPQQEELHICKPNLTARDFTGEPIEYWVLASSQPEIGPDGTVRSIMGSIADISQLKWAQGLRDRRLKEAEETKRQQNEFIDITSHEMRNPLSAILICADDIRDTLSQHDFKGEDAKVAQDCVEAANNIALCVNHQKSIVDDILTVSKLDSNLLCITPVAVQPVNVVLRAMNMFKPESQAKDIDFQFHADPSLQELNVEWVNLDPSRILQIIVNLITNAIKFTQGSPRRVISIRLSASLDQPKIQNKTFEYVPTRIELIDITAGDDWGNGELLYIRVDVEDTGCGLTDEGKRVLFERFAQASPRTHAHYGGSGLGLFISRQLTELHGGQIGVSSEYGLGSTFGFFIQARRAPVEQRPAPAILSSVTLQTNVHTERLLGKPTPPPLISMNSSPAAIPLRSNLKDAGMNSVENALHILIVEDNLVNQRVLSKQLQKAGCIVYTADNGFHALDHLATTSFQQATGTPLSIVLMDWEMPDMDGLTCVGRIREMERDGIIRDHVPVIAVTANVRDEQMKVALHRGMDDVVSKPFRIPELLSKIKMALYSIVPRMID